MTCLRLPLALLACAVVAALPAGALAAGGSDVVLDGTLVTVHSDDFAHGKSAISSRLETAQGTFDLRYPTAEPVLPRTTHVRVHGARSGSTIAVAADGVAAAPGGTVVAATTGAKRVLVVLAYFGDQSVPSSPTQSSINGVVFTNSNSVANYYSTVSWGQLTLSGNVTPWVQIPSTDEASSCNWPTWGSQANAAAANAGYNPANFNYVQYVLAPGANSCGWAGLAYLPGTQSWIRGEWADLRVSGHELGHNFGTHHSNSYTCTQSGTRVALSTSGNCSSSEYGDPFSIMGQASTYEHTNFSRGNFGFLSAANTQDVTTTGTYSLRPIEPSSPTSVQAIRISRGDGTYLLLEWRQPDGALFDNFSSSSPQATGVTVRIVYSYSTMAQSQLVDCTPGTSTFTDAALAVNQSVYDPVSNVTLTTTALTSSATVHVQFGVPVPTNTSVPTVSGTAQQGQTLTATTGSWTGSPTTYAYQWQRSVGGVWQSIGGATATTYVPVSADVGYPLRVQVIATNAGGPSAPASSSGTGLVAGAPVPVSATAPAISGTAKQGVVLTASPGTWTNSPTSYAYQWQRYSSGWQPIAGATASTYTPGSADVFTALRVQVIAANASGSSAPAFSAATASVVPATPVNTSPPTFTGAQQVGQTIFASAGSWTSSPGSYAYQWQRYSGGWQTISGATGSSYAPTSTDLGLALRVQVIASNAGGSSSPAYSAPTSGIQSSTATVPVSSGLPAVAGIVQQGRTLTASTGSWTNAPTSYAYQWQRLVSGVWQSISGATISSYLVGSTDLGLALRVQVVASNASGASYAAGSAPTATVLPAAPTSTSAPTVSGTTKQGRLLTTSPGSWTSSPTSYAYQWQRLVSGVWQSIGAATAATYTPVAGDVGYSLRVQVVASNAGGSSGPAYSAATAAVAA